jgi:hypothetical protein
MDTIMKACKIHGELDLKDIYFDPASAREDISKLRTLRCAICRRFGKSAWKKRNPEAYAEEKRKQNEKRKENIDEHNARKRMLLAEHKKNNPELWKKRQKQLYNERKARFGGDYSLFKQCGTRGITPEIYYEMIESQENKCGLCNKEETCKDPKHDRVRRLSIDHCHKTGKVRALLCHSCNTGIGKFKDDINLLNLAIAYLRTYK